MTSNRKTNTTPQQEPGKLEYTSTVYRLVIPELTKDGEDTGRLWWGEIEETGIAQFRVSTKVDYKLLETEETAQLVIVVPKLFESKKFVMALCAMYFIPKILLLDPEALRKIIPAVPKKLSDWVTYLNREPALTSRIVEIAGAEFNPSERIAEFFDRLKK